MQLMTGTRASSNRGGRPLCNSRIDQTVAIVGRQPRGIRHRSCCTHAHPRIGIKGRGHNLPRRNTNPSEAIHGLNPFPPALNMILYVVLCDPHRDLAGESDEHREPHKRHGLQPAHPGRSYGAGEKSPSIGDQPPDQQRPKDSGGQIETRVGHEIPTHRPSVDEVRHERKHEQDMTPT